MSNPPNLIRLDPAFRILLPEGATGGYGTLTYEGEYRVAALLAGAATDFALDFPDNTQPRLARPRSLTGGDLYFLGALEGDPEPPYLTLRVYPSFPSVGGVVATGDPITYSGRPHEYPAGSGLWDLRDLGGDNRPVLLARETASNLKTAAEQALTRTEQLQGDIDQAILDAGAAGAQAKSTADTAAASALARQQANDVQAAQTLAQVTAQQQLNNTQAAATAGMRVSNTLASLPAAAGLYRILGGLEIGQVWERLGDGSKGRRAELEAASAAQLTAAQAATASAALVAALSTRYMTSGTTALAVPTPAEVDAYAAAHPENPSIPGSRRSGSTGAMISQRYVVTNGTGAWTADGDRLASETQAQRLADVAAVRAPTTVANAAALSGRPADQYTLTDTQELVAWDGAAITARGPAPAAAADVAARFTASPLRRSDYSGVMVQPGGRTMYPLSPNDLTPEDGISIVKLNGQKYYKTNMVCDAREFRLAAGSLDTQVDATAGLKDFFGTAQRDITMVLPKGFYYTREALTVGSMSSVRYDFQGVLRPWKAVDAGDPQFTDFLVRLWGGQRAEDGRFGSIDEGNQWGDTAYITRMDLDGRWLSRGFEADLLDHFQFSNIRVHRTRGAAYRLSNLREGSYQSCRAVHCMAGDDPGVVWIQDKSATLDANNSFSLNDFQSIWHLGRNLYVDQHVDAPKGNVPRLLDFVACHFEDIPGTGRPFGGSTNLQTQPVTLDRNWVRAGFGIAFLGGIMNGGRIERGAGADATAQLLAGGSALRVGDGARSTSQYDPVRMITFPGMKFFGLEGNGAALKITANTSAIQEPPEMYLADQMVPLVTATAGSMVQKRRTATNYVGTGSDELLVLTAESGANSPPLTMEAPSGGRARIYTTTTGKTLIEHTTGKHFVSDEAGNIYVRGSETHMGLGVAGNDVRYVYMQVRTSPPDLVVTGVQAMCDGTTWNPAGKPAGSKAYPVYYDGSAWKAIGT